jgi:hypothetical protein
MCSKHYTNLLLDGLGADLSWQSLVGVTVCCRGYIPKNMPIEIDFRGSQFCKFRSAQQPKILGRIFFVDSASWHISTVKQT